MARGRYVVAARRAGWRVHDIGSSEKAMAHTLNMFRAANLIGPPSESRDLFLIEADQEEVEERRKSLPEAVILEPEIIHRLEILLPHGPPTLSQAASSTAPWSSFEITVTGAGSPIANAEVWLCTRGHSPLRERSDTSGICRFAVPTGSVPETLVVAPAGGYWAMVDDNPRSGMVVDCPPLPNGSIGWWHELLGIDQHDRLRGKGIKVGVIDSGAGPHPSLSHVVQAGTFVNGGAAGASGDAGCHGSHVSGIIGAQPHRKGDFAGVAPGCELVVTRVVDSDEAEFNQVDIVNALEALLKHEVDIVNMSFVAPQPSIVLLNRIQAALDHGTLCVCAAGNEGTGTVKWPAAFSETVGVSAIGRERTAPSGTLAATREPPDAVRRNGDLYLANFSCFGSGLDCAAPGVGIVSTVPGSSGVAPYRDMCGTSMACPGVSGLLAAALSGDTTYLQLPRDRSRSEAARKKLQRCLVDVGLAQAYQGEGVPHL